MALLLSVFLVASLLSAFAAGDGVLAGDVAIARVVQQAPETGAGDLARLINAFGATPVILTLGATLGLGLLALRRPRPAIFVFAAMGARATNLGFKAIFDSPRPTSDLVRISEHPSGLGFPSAHVMDAVLFYGTLLWLAHELPLARYPRLILQAVAWGILVTCGFGRVYVGAHWPSDVVGAYLWGCLLLGVLIRVYQLTIAWIASGSYDPVLDAPLGEAPDHRDGAVPVRQPRRRHTRRQHPRRNVSVGEHLLQARPVRRRLGRPSGRPFRRACR